MGDLKQRAAELSPEKRALLQELLRKKAAKKLAAEAPRRRGDEGPAPLSYSQERLWLLHQIDPDSIAYNLASGTRFRGDLDVFALARTVGEIVRRHESLRTTFDLGDAGEPVQVISEAPRSAEALGRLLPRVDLSHLPEAIREAELRRLARQNARHRFDLARGPLLALVLVHLGEADHALFQTMHHIVSDAWSTGVFIRELAALYPHFRDAGKDGGTSGAEATLPLEPLPIQYADFAVWQRRRISGERLEQQLEYWRQKLVDAPVLELPADRPRSAVRAVRSGQRLHLLDRELQERLARLARRHGATTFMLYLAAFEVVLGRLAGEERVLVGSPVANRHVAELEPLIGFFVNTLVLGTDLAGDPTFAEVLNRMRESTLAAHEHQDLPFEKLVAELKPERDLGRTPFFQVMLVMQNQPRGALELPEVALEPVPMGGGTVIFDLVLGIFELEGGVRLQADFRADLFDKTTIARLLTGLETLLRAVAADFSARLSELPCESPAVRHQVLVEWNDTASAFPGEELPRGETLAELFRDTVRRHGERPALLTDEAELTYAELHERVVALAKRLAGEGVGAGDLVAISLPRSVEMIVALLGVLEAGAAYVPLDPSLPKARREEILADCGARLVLDGEVHPGDAEADPRPAHPDDLAYVIYTSGSTGKPKGVGVPHRGAVNTLLWRLETFHPGPGDTILQNIAFTFDPSIWQIFGALLSGARLMLAKPGGEKDFPYLVRRLAEAEGTITDLAPSMLQVFLEQKTIRTAEALRLLFAGGEALPPALATRFAATFPDADLRNIYGPTEASIDAACWPARPEAGATNVPIGRPVANKNLWVVDDRLRRTPLGAPGELLIGGAGLARGYLGRPGQTAASFIPDPFTAAAGQRLYKTGDLVRRRADGALEFLGRRDRQVKVRGFRIELGEIESVLGEHGAVREAAVVARPVEVDGQRDNRLVAYVGGDAVEGELRRHLAARLPAYMVPPAFVLLESLPRNVSGKVDFKALPDPGVAAAGGALEGRPASIREGGATAGAPASSGLERQIAKLWRDVLEVEDVGLDENFFELGGHSLLLVRIHGRLEEALGREVPVVDLFEHPTVRSLARHLDPRQVAAALERVDDRAAAELAALAGEGTSAPPLAVIAMVGRFPDAPSVDEFWQRLVEGHEGIRPLTDEELRAAGVGSANLENPDFVKAATRVEGVEDFDAAFFDMRPREAEVLDPQQRLFLEAAWQALEEAGIDPSRTRDRIGVYAGTSANSYLFNQLLANPAFIASVGFDQTTLASDKDFLATRVSYKLDLRGPSLTVQTACSTSLVAVHLAAQALWNRQCEVALAGGVSLSVPQERGYLYREGGTNSPDGHIRAFDADAGGMVKGNGLGVVVLKPLSQALEDGDPIRAVVRGTAINNDGSNKVGYTAPSVEGQAEVIAAAQRLAGVGPEEIGYIETHGTGTPLGDPIEIAALKKVFGGRREDGRPPVLLGSVKTNIGHLDSAAGVSGLIKAALVVEHGEIPPSLHFKRPNPALGLEQSPFEVAARRSAWHPADGPRRAGVSSFGIGGTNAHAIVEEPPRREASGPSRPWQLLVFSARTPSALDATTSRLADHLEHDDSPALADVAKTLLVGRRGFERRRIAVVRTDTADTAADAVHVLGGDEPERLVDGAPREKGRGVAFLFPGQGAQFAGMLEGLARREEVFRGEVDRMAEILEPDLGVDLRTLLFPAPEAREEADRRLEETALTQPALFVVEVALARQWEAWGIRPAAMLGHSIGEYVAAYLAGVFKLEDALALVAARGRLMQDLPGGDMLALALPVDDVTARLEGHGDVEIAAMNGPKSTVVSGPPEAIQAFAESLEADGVAPRRLHTSHAFHSAMMDEILEPFAEKLAAIRLAPPQAPVLSNLTGTWLTAEEATDPAYWTEHLRRTVRFADGLEHLLENADLALLEVGPGRTLSTLARRVVAARDGEKPPAIVASGRHPKAEDDDQAVLLGALGRLWLAGVDVDGEALFAGERRLKVRLPTYPFERRRYWVEAAGGGMAAARGVGGPPARLEDPVDWRYLPTWNEAPISPPRDVGGTSAGTSRDWLIFADAHGIGDKLAERLRARGDRVVTVVPGSGVALDGDAGALRPGHGEDIELLRSRLAAAGFAPRRFVHLWSLGAAVGPVPPLARLEADLERGFYTLLGLAQALAESGGGAPEDNGDTMDGVELTVVADRLHQVLGDEDVEPVNGTLLGPLKVVPLEMPGIKSRAVDVVVPPPGSAWTRFIDQLEAEVLAPVDEPVVAWRGRRRFVQSFAPVSLAALAPGAELGGLPAGAILVTGGFGGVGLELARGIAEARQGGPLPARLALVGRTLLPPREHWNEIAEEDVATRRRVDAVRELEELGAEVVAIAADVADPAAMSAGLDAARERLGPIRGVIHAAGLAGGGVLALQDKGSAAEVLAPKVRGTLVLEDLLRADPVETVLVCSSLAALLGGVGQVSYAAANAFLDTFAWSRDGRFGAAGGRVVSVNWDAWRETGMAFDEARRKRGGEGDDGPLPDGLLSAEGVDIFHRILADGEPQSIVSTLDFRALAAHFARLRRGETAGEGGASRARSTLPAPAHERPEMETAFAAPRSDAEKRLAAVYAEVLGLEEVGVHDDFTELGGDSLLAIQVASRVRRDFETELPLKDLFAHPTVARLAEHLGFAEPKGLGGAPAPDAGEETPAPTATPEAPPRPDGDPPLSFAQQRLWFLDQLEGDSSIYNLFGAHRLRGEVDDALLRRTLAEVIRRHEALRTTFPAVDGEPVQRIAPEEEAGASPPFHLVDFANIPDERRERLAREAARVLATAPFDLATGPLLRVAVLRLAPRERILVFAFHHIVSDGWSMRVFVGELLKLYGAFAAGRPASLPELRYHYADFALEQRRRLGEDGLSGQLGYWRERLAGLPEALELPADRPRPPVQSFRGRHLPFAFAAGTLGELRRFARGEGRTLFTVLLAALATVLSRLAGQDDLAIGAPMANRERLETEGLIGFFVNTLVLRLDLSGEPTFRELLDRVQTTVLEAHANQDLPFERLVEELQPERSLARSPLFQVLFAYQSIPGGVGTGDGSRDGQGGGAGEGLAIENVGLESGHTLFDLSLNLDESPQGIGGFFELSTDLFDTSRIRRLACQLRTVLGAARQAPDRRISDLPLLAPAEAHQVLVEWTATPDTFWRPRPVHELFFENLPNVAERPALIFADRTLSYAELADRSLRLAQELLRLGVQPDEGVAISLERSPEMAIAVLGVLAAGAVCVPVDPAYPADRIRFMLADARAAVVLTDAATHPTLDLPDSTQALLLGQTGPGDLTLVPGEGTPEDGAQPPSHPWHGRSEAEGGRRPFEHRPRGVPSPGTSLDRLLYIIYTSGSTGRPKGVALPHRAFAHLLPWHLRTHVGGVRTLQFASLSFDVSFYEMFTCWLSGGTLVMADEATRRDVAALARLLDEQKVEKATFPVVVLETLARLVEAGEVPPPSTLVEATSTGEQLRVSDAVRKLFVRLGARLHNHYGPSETHVVTAHALPADPATWPSHPPIGRPVDDSHVTVVDRRLRPLPVGVPGELLLGGTQLARGYLDRPALTAERFIPDAVSGVPGARFYRSGDLARTLVDGTVEYLGRIDHQVKIRGFRVEPAEIEAVLGRHEDVREAVVVARVEIGAPARLVAYLLPAGDVAPTSQELRLHLRDSLPEHMVPSAFVALEAFPLSPNGKVDRKALPDPEDDAPTARAAAPQGPLEELVASIWESVLGKEGIGATDDFFALGGHSLLATRVVARLRERCGVEIELRELFEAPTVAGLAARVEAAMRDDLGVRLPRIERIVPRPEPVPVSFGQERLWFLDQLAPGTATYNVPVALAFRGPLDPDALAEALTEVVRRHEVLRSRFVLVDEEPVQEVAAPMAIEVPVIDLADADDPDAAVRRHVTEAARRPFDLGAAPLLRAVLLRREAEHHVLSLTVHHIASDGWSLGVLLREMVVLYGAFLRGEPSPLAELPVQYADVALWQRRHLAGDVLDRHLDFWRERLAGERSILELPTDRPRPAVQTFRGERRLRRLPAALTATLGALARDQGVTRFMVFLAAVQAHLNRLTGETAIAVGTPVANRDRTEIEDLIGFFVNTLVLKSHLDPTLGFRDLLAQVRAETLGAFAHQDLPFEKLVEELDPERNLSHAPLFQVMFQMQPLDTAGVERGNGGEGLQIETLPVDLGAAKFDLTVGVEGSGEHLALAVEYNADLFDETTMDRFLRHTERLLDAAAKDPGRRLDELPLLLPGEAQQVVHEWNDTAIADPITYPSDGATLASLLDAAAKRHPGAPALTFEGETLTYGELAARSNRLARHLRKIGVPAEGRVGVAMPRSAELLVAIHAVVKAGAAYVPLDLDDPEDRLSFKLTDSSRGQAAPLTLVRGTPPETVEAAAKTANVRLLDVFADAEAIDAQSSEPFEITIDDRQAAYMIYTSGSTGRPKGTVNAHRGIVNRLRWMQDAFPLGADDTVLQKTPVSFDVSVWELFWPFLVGARLVVARPEGHKDPSYLAEILHRENVTTLHFVPSMLELFLEEPGLEKSATLRSLRRIITSGEALPFELVERAAKLLPERVEVHNLYGPTEAAVDVTWWPTGAASALDRELRRVPIGRPIANTTTHVLDRRMEPAAIGVAGELHLGGVQLARGYEGRPELTAERFIPDPTATKLGARLYKTGDRTRLLADGRIEYLGRLDFQVKLRGLRIELGEIENALRDDPGVTSAVVLVHKVAGTDQLLAFVTGEAPSADVLRSRLADYLPDYMVPGFVVALDEMPLSPSGKVDRKALVRLAPSAPTGAASTSEEAPQSETERRIAEIWADVLGAERVGLNDNFFDLGGQSLLMVRAFNRLKASYDPPLELPLVEAFAHPTVATLARRVDGLVAPAGGPATPAARASEEPAARERGQDRGERRRAAQERRRKRRPRRGKE